MADVGVGGSRAGWAARRWKTRAAVIYFIPQHPPWSLPRRPAAPAPALQGSLSRTGSCSLACQGRWGRQRACAGIRGGSDLWPGGCARQGSHPSQFPGSVFGGSTITPGEFPRFQPAPSLAAQRRFLHAASALCPLCPWETRGGPGQISGGPGGRWGLGVGLASGSQHVLWARATRGLSR